MSRFPGIIFVGARCSDNELLDGLPSDFRALVEESNGFVAYRGGLHIRGIGSQPPWHSLENAWHGPEALHRLYPAVQSTDLPFGQDCLGDQFLLRNGHVSKLSGETGEIEDLGMTLNEFLEHSARDPVDFLGLQPLLQFEQEGGRLFPGESLSVYPPFVFEESRQGVALSKLPTRDRLLFLADLARQIARVQNGEQAKIEIKA